MRKPKVENKYNLNMKKIKELGVNREKVGEPYFWRNNVINAWCISRGVGRGYYGSMNSFWIGVYDKKDRIGITLSCMEDMCSYNFKEFYQLEDIDSEVDLELQEAFLGTINFLIDEGIFYIK